MSALQLTPVRGRRAGPLTALPSVLKSNGAVETAKKLGKHQALLSSSQRLFEDLMARPAPDEEDSLHDDSSSNSQVVWALVAVFAAQMARETGLSTQGEELSTDEEVAGAQDMSLDGNGRKQPHVELSEALVETQVDLPRFVRYYSTLLDQLVLNPELFPVLTQLKFDTGVSITCFGIFRSIFQKEVATMSTSALTADVVMELAWLLFIVCKRVMQSNMAGLANQYYLVLAVLRLCLPTLLRSNTSSQDMEEQAITTLTSMNQNVRSNAEELLLQRLCSDNTPHVQPDDVQLTVNRAVVAASSVLETMETSTKRLFNAENEIPYDLEVIRFSISCLSAFYEQSVLVAQTQVDERLFLIENKRQLILGEWELRSDTEVEPEPPQLVETPVKRPRTNSYTPNRMSGGIARTPPMNPLPSPNGRMSSSKPPTTPQHRLPGSVHPSPFSLQWQHMSSPSPASASMNISFRSARRTSSASATPNTTARAFLRAERSAGNGVKKSPLSAAVEIDAWLETHFTLRDEADVRRSCSHLREHWKRISNRNIEMELDALLGELSDKIQVHGGSSKETFMSIDGGANRSEALIQLAKRRAKALYYFVMETWLSKSRSIDGMQWTSRRPVANLLSVCLELMLKAHSLVAYTFPRVAAKLQVSTVDFEKTIVSVAKYAPSLPPALSKHLNDVEKQILNVYIWKPQSGLFEMLESKNLSNASKATVQRLLKKILTLAATRTHRLGEELAVRAGVLNQCWTAFKEALTQYPRALFENQSLDLVVACCIASICKVNHVPDAGLRSVQRAYKKTTSGEATTVDAIYSGKRLSEYYTGVYMAHMKLLVVQFKAKDEQEAAANDAELKLETQPFGRRRSSSVSTSSSDAEIVANAASETLDRILSGSKDHAAPDESNGLFTDVAPRPVAIAHTSPKRVGSSNVYVAPMQQSRVQQMRSPASGARMTVTLGNFSPSRDLDTVNEYMQEVSQRVRSEGPPGQARRLLDSPPSASPSRKRLHE